MRKVRVHLRVKRMQLSYHFNRISDNKADHLRLITSSTLGIWNLALSFPGFRSTVFISISTVDYLFG